MPNVNLGPYNTLPIAAASGVYTLTSGSGWAGAVDLLNIGPGSIFIRSDTNPVVNDPASLELPASIAFNGLTLNPGGLFVIAGADTTITLRLR